MPNRSGIEEFFGILRYRVSSRSESFFAVTNEYVFCASRPYPANPPPDIRHRHVTRRIALREVQRGSTRGHRLEPRQQFVGDEPRPLRVRMLVALAVIVEIVAVGMQDMQLGLRTSEGDVEQSSLLFDLGLGFGGQIRRDVAVGRVQDENRLPLQTLHRMDGAEGEIVLVQVRIGGEVYGLAVAKQSS